MWFAFSSWENHRLARLLFGSFLMARFCPPVGGGGAEPMVNNVPPDEVEGAIWVGALKGELGADPNPVPVPPKLTGVAAGGRLVLPVAGDAG